MPTSPYPYILLTSIIASIGAAISTLEWLFNRRELLEGGLYSWRILGSRPLFLGEGWLSESLKQLLSPRVFVGILVLRVVALLALPFAIWFVNGALLVLAIVVLTSLLLSLRSPYGLDGSDQMSVLIFGALFLAHLGGSTLALEAGLWFVAGQSCLSYFTSGFAKITSLHWRAGDVVFRIFNTRTYGYAPVARFLYARPGLTRMLTWAAVVMECIFPLALLLGFPGCLVLIGWGVVFHAMNAIIMGLNSFFWSFVATYPAVIYGAVMVERLLHRGV